MSSIIQSGSVFHVARSDDITVHSTGLPAATYAVEFDEFKKEFFLKRIDNFTMPKKIYGDVTRNAWRILDTFAERGGNTGVLLSGIKGAGKTLLAKKTSVIGLERGIPTIVLNRDWHGDKFNTFISSIDNPCIVLFDEFEKIYNWESQRKVLTLFDGVFPSKKLFMVTSNREQDLVEYFMNRPGRIYYNFKFDTLEKIFVEAYCNENLKDKSGISDIIKYSEIFSFFNFDMLACIVEEMNRYGETLHEVLKVLNIVPENRKADTYKVSLVSGPINITIDEAYTNFQPHDFEYAVEVDENEMPYQIQNSPLKDTIKKLAVPNFYGDNSLLFKAAMLSSFDGVNGKFVYRITSQDQTLELHIKRNKLEYLDVKHLF